MSKIRVINTKPETPTLKQVEYLQILFDDLGFTLTQRNAWLKAETGRDTKYLDQLTKAEASRFITELKEVKERKLGKDEEKWP